MPIPGLQLPHKPAVFETFVFSEDGLLLFHPETADLLNSIFILSHLPDLQTTHINTWMCRIDYFCVTEVTSFLFFTDDGLEALNFKKS